MSWLTDSRNHEGGKIESPPFQHTPQVPNRHHGESHDGNPSRDGRRTVAIEGEESVGVGHVRVGHFDSREWGQQACRCGGSQEHNQAKKVAHAKANRDSKEESVKMNQKFWGGKETKGRRQAGNASQAIAVGVFTSLNTGLGCRVLLESPPILLADLARSSEN